MRLIYRYHKKLSVWMRLLINKMVLRWPQVSACNFINRLLSLHKTMLRTESRNICSKSDLFNPSAGFKWMGCIMMKIFLFFRRTFFDCKCEGKDIPFIHGWFNLEANRLRHRKPFAQVERRPAWMDKSSGYSSRTCLAAAYRTRFSRDPMLNRNSERVNLPLIGQQTKQSRRSTTSFKH